MSIPIAHKKWGIYQVHRPGFPAAPYYSPLSQHGSWNSKRKAQQMSTNLAHQEDRDYELTVRECGVDFSPTAAPHVAVGSSTAVIGNALAALHDTGRKAQ